MWKLKIAEGSGPYLYSTNNFVGRQTWEYDPNGGTDEERQTFQKAREEYIERKKKGYPASADLFTRIQLVRESGIDLLSTPPVRVGVDEHITHETVTIAVKKGVRLHRAIQASDGHWPAENGGPLFFTPPLIIALYISGAINTVLTTEHKKEMVRYIYNQQNEDGGWGFYVEGHSTMIGSALSYVALRLLGEGVDENCAITRGRKWLLDHGGAIRISSWGKLYLSSPESGGFSVWEPANPQPYQVLNPSEVFADIVSEKVHVDCTASIIHALVLFNRIHPQHRGEEIHISVANAVRFLEEQQWQDGSWYGYWGICFIYGTYFALNGLVGAGKTYENNQAVRKGVKFLLQTQNEEGGWGESGESRTSMKYTPLKGNRTNFVQTSWAMLGLMRGGQMERDPAPLHAASRLLINAQMDDGGFPQQEITGVVMKNCKLHYALYRNVFPLWALAEYRKRVWPSCF